MTEEGAVFRSHIDGRLLELSPERAVAIQEALGSDVAMVLDHVVRTAQPAEVVRDATERTRPLGRAAAARPPAASDQALFAIVQGGLDLRAAGRVCRALAGLDFAGYAVGGLSVGETPAEMYRVLDATVPELPADRPRYLMGVGRPEDLLEAVAPGHRPVRLRDAHPQRPQRHGLYRRRAAAAAQLAIRAGRSAAGRGLSVPGLPPQPRLSAAPVHGPRDARARSCCRSTT